ncbi:MAG: hypothetical protein ACOCP8_02855 [archaeon]
MLYFAINLVFHLAVLLGFYSITKCSVLTLKKISYWLRKKENKKISAFSKICNNGYQLKLYQGYNKIRGDK